MEFIVHERLILTIHTNWRRPTVNNCLFMGHFFKKWHIFKYFYFIHINNHLNHISYALVICTLCITNYILCLIIFISTYFAKILKSIWEVVADIGEVFETKGRSIFLMENVVILFHYINTYSKMDYLNA